MKNVRFVHIIEFENLSEHCVEECVELN